jgi:hypothetical protein
MNVAPLVLPFSYLLYMLIYLSILPFYPLVTLFSFFQSQVEALSSAVHQIVDNKLNGCGCVHVLDDFLFVGQGNSPLFVADDVFFFQANG